MTKSSLLLMSVTLAVFGISTMLGHPPWGAVTGIAFVLTAAAMGAGALTGSSRGDSYKIERTVSAQRLPNSLAALSATAILAVYAAGYYRTREAAEKLEEQASRRKPIPALVASVQIPAAVSAPAIQPQAAEQTQASNSSKAAKPSSSRTKTSAQSQAMNAPAATTPETPKTAAVSGPAPETASKAVVAVPELPYKDGAYSAWGTCRHGDLETTVIIDQGKITSAKITQCLTRYPCSWIANLPGQVVTRQSSDVDYVSGATESTDAYYQAVAAALAKALE